MQISVYGVICLYTVKIYHEIPLGSLGSLSKSGPAQDLNCSSDCVLLDRGRRCYSWGLFEPLSQLVGHSPECSYHPW